MKRHALIGLIVAIAALGVGELPVQSQNLAAAALSFTESKQINRTRPIRVETARDVKLEKAIHSVYPDYRQLVSKYPDIFSRSSYSYRKFDLNGDNKPEIIAFLWGTIYFCPKMGCPTLIFRKVGQDYRLISKIDFTRAPIIVTPQKTAGWSNLVVNVHGGGRQFNGTDGYYLLRFNGKTYPSTADEGTQLSKNSTITGRSLFTEDYADSIRFR